MNDDPADPRRDQIANRKRDLKRWRELTGPYVTDPTAPYRDDALQRMPADKRAEADELSARIGIVDSEHAAQHEETLGLLAELEAFLLDVLDHERVFGAPAGPQDLQEAREMLNDVNRLRSRLTGLGIDGEE